MSGAAWAVVVSRTGSGAKSRLADALPAEERSALAARMLENVLTAAAGAGLDGVVAVLDRPLPPARAADPARPLVIPDPGLGLNAAVEAGLRAARDAGAETAVVLAGDLPLLGADDVRALVDAAGGRRVVVVAPDRHGTGTNALVLRPPLAIAPAFGPGSAARHAETARAAGIAPVRLRRDGLALDVDTPDDLAELARARGARV